MKKEVILGWVVVAIIVIAAAVWAFPRLQPDSGANPTPSFSPSPTTVISYSPLPSLFPTQGIPEGWKQYESREFGFRLAHPPTAQLHRQPEGVSVVHLGPTQSEGTELYDGYALTLSSRRFPEGVTSLQDYAEKEVVNAAQHGTVIQPLSEVTLQGRRAFQYRLEGLGEFTHYFVGQGEGRVLAISYLAPDPSNAGYANTVQTILGTLQFTAIP